MCTYTYQRAVCPCVKGLQCPQMLTLGRTIQDGEMLHFAKELLCIDELGAACDYQRRLYGRHARATKRCPRYNPDDPHKRMLEAVYTNKTACIACVVSCAPPNSHGRALSPDMPERDKKGDEAADGAQNRGPSPPSFQSGSIRAAIMASRAAGGDGTMEVAVIQDDSRFAMRGDGRGMEGGRRMDGGYYG